MLRIVAAVPEGRLVTFADVGAHLEVAPRHVAYILASLTDIERATLPWHRAVAAEGGLGAAKRDPDGTGQAALLAAEGVALDEDRRVEAFAARRIAVAGLAHGVPRQVRPPDAPSAGPPSRRRRKA